MNIRSKLAVGVCALAFLGAACGSDDSPSVGNDATATTAANHSTVATAPAAQGDSVTIRTFAFSPNPIHVKAGATVTWTNEDQILHTVTSGTRANPDGKFDLQLDGAGKSDHFVFAEPGTYSYFCSRHPNMDAQVVVE